MKINYIKKFGNDGTVYNQTITIEENLIKNFNKMVEVKKRETAKKKIYTDEDLKILNYLDFLKLGNNYSNLTTLKYFINYCFENIPDLQSRKRIKWRNTVIKVI